MAVKTKRLLRKQAQTPLLILSPFLWQGTARLESCRFMDIPYAYNQILGVYETESGARIGFVSVNEVYDEESVEAYLQSGIVRLREENVNLVLACCHWE